MGLIKAATTAVGGTLAEQWKDALHCQRMDNTVMLRKGTRMNQGKGANVKGDPEIITNGSTIIVEENTCMLTIDNGKITNIVTEPGQYTLDNSSAPSLFVGQITDTLKEALNRFMFGGTPNMEQRVVYINLMPLPGIPFGTGQPVPYPDPRYNTTINLRFYGTFEIQIEDAEMAVRFYQQVANKGSGAGDMLVTDTFKSEQYKNEFMQSMMKALNLLSAQGVSYNQFSSHLLDLTNHVQNCTKDTWMTRGFKVINIGMGPVTICDESKELLKDRLKADTMLGGDVQRAMMAGSVARGIEAAAGNEGGAMMGFMGMNMAMNTGGGIMGQMGQAPENTMQAQQMQQGQQGVGAFPQSSGFPQAGAFPGGGVQPTQVTQPAQVMQASADSWSCVCGVSNSGRFCADCGTAKPAPVASSDWKCLCGADNAGKFCANCGTAKPEAPAEWSCVCGKSNTGRFCADCGKAKV
ncbi:MAG: SPFH domain-containing protein [Oscillospiraceae bacterium]|nr:SPFH domain-containing protein [Oscillospiraceae bacterium]